MSSKKCYIVSGDIEILLAEWAKQKNFTIPTEDFFVELRLNFSIFTKQIFPGFRFIPEINFVGIKSLVERTNLTPVSLDRVYYKTKHQLNITRLVDERGLDVGLGSRAGATNIKEQLDLLANFNLDRIVLVDDVVFSGQQMIEVVDMFGGLGIQVPTICTSIAIKEGIERLQSKGIDVKSLFTFDEVIDEVCERDFYPGVPFSGRQLVGSGNIGVPYILQFGNPNKWASIPESKQIEFSVMCLKQTILLWKEIGDINNRALYPQDLPRRIINLSSNKIPIVDQLQNCINVLTR